MLWKNDTLPPSNLAFKVTTAAPHHVTMNTAPNTKPLSSVAVRAGLILLAGELWLDKRMARVRHRMRGPHRSQSFSSAPACSSACHCVRSVWLRCCECSSWQLRARQAQRWEGEGGIDLAVGHYHTAHLVPHPAKAVTCSCSNTAAK